MVFLQSSIDPETPQLVEKRVREHFPTCYFPTFAMDKQCLTIIYLYFSWRKSFDWLLAHVSPFNTQQKKKLKNPKTGKKKVKTPVR